MNWILISGAVLCSWAMLRTFGGERERRVEERRRAEEQPPEPSASVSPPKPAPRAARK